MNYVQFNFEKQYIKDFINFPKKIYPKGNNEDSKEIEQILKEKHPLSKYFKLYKFLIYQEKEVVGRFAITIYPNDTTAYIGLVEWIKDEEVAKYLFNVAEDFAKKNNYEKILGPVDSSFWIKYRLKINKFEQRPYTGEPYNQEYYFKMFLDNGYQVIEHYTSTIYRNVDTDYKSDKYSNSYHDFIQKGYQIKSLNRKEFENTLRQLYDLITKLYSDFPVYKYIEKEDFIQIFKKYQKIINPEMVKLAYHNKQLVGFCISIPNYENMVYQINLINLIRILKQKRKPKEYIMLYMGVEREHRGIGRAIVHDMIEELRKNHLPSIGALIKDGKATQNYAKELIEGKYEYVLLEKKL